MMLKNLLVVLLLLLDTITGFYLPGVAPVEFQLGDPVVLKVNKLTSVHTQLPYAYYSMPFCAPDQLISKVENLGEILLGDRIMNSPYKITAEVNSLCKVLCKMDYTPTQVKAFADKVAEDYQVHWIIDNLPAATPKLLQNAKEETITYHESGFPLGINGKTDDKGNGPHALNNHVNIKLLFHKDPANYEGLRIVGFEVDPQSKKHKLDYTPGDPDSVPSTCTAQEGVPPLELVIKQGESTLPVVWTYSVTWEESATTWANRWDSYLINTDPQIHWFSIINSLMIVLFLTGMVAMIMMRTLHADFLRYNQMDPDEVEETGWKLVRGDVFRPPKRPMLLSVLVGSGVQVLGMTVVTLIFAALGFLSPANRGGLMTAGVVLYVVMGIFAGYFSTRTYVMLHGMAWKKNTMMTSVLFPGMIFAIFFFLNLFIWGEKSSGAVPFGTLVALVALWFGISLPLVFFGSYFAFRKPAMEPPVRTNQIPRQIPEQVWYMSPIFSILMGGILPFGAVFIELFFIMSAVWGQQFYYIFGFLIIVFGILVLTCAEITIVMCYFQLCSEDYHWWWRSYLTAGASAFYMFLYSIFYFFTKLDIDHFVSGLLYFGYTSIMALIFFVMTGAVGFFACLFFVTRIYSRLHLD